MMVVEGAEAGEKGRSIAFLNSEDLFEKRGRIKEVHETFSLRSINFRTVDT